MKKLLLYFMVCFTFLCFLQNKVEIKSSMKKSILKYNQKHLKDPSSYQLMSLTILSTETLGNTGSYLLERIPISISYIDSEIDKNNSVIISRKQEIKKLNEGVGNEVEIEDALETIRVYEADNVKQNKEKKEWELAIVETKNELQNKHIISYTVEHRYRAKNGYGALDIYTEVIKFDDNCNIKYLQPKD